MKNILAIGGTVLAGLAASACCWIPALLGASAAGTLGFGAALAPYRPYLLVLTGVFLLLGFTMVYRKPTAECCDDSGCCTPAAMKRRNINKGVMWAVAFFAVGMTAYPYIAEARLNSATAERLSEQQASSLPAQQLVFNVEGMDCAACAAPIMDNVEEVPGVESAIVDFDAATLSVQVGSPAPTEEAILAAVEDAGFKAELD